MAATALSSRPKYVLTKVLTRFQTLFAFRPSRVHLLKNLLKNPLKNLLKNLLKKPKSGLRREPLQRLLKKTNYATNQKIIFNSENAQKKKKTSQAQQAHTSPCDIDVRTIQKIYSRFQKISDGAEGGVSGFNGSIRRNSLARVLRA